MAAALRTLGQFALQAPTVRQQISPGQRPGRNTVAMGKASGKRRQGARLAVKPFLRATAPSDHGHKPDRALQPRLICHRTIQCKMRMHNFKTRAQGLAISTVVAHSVPTTLLEKAFELMIHEGRRCHALWSPYFADCSSPRSSRLKIRRPTTASSPSAPMASRSISISRPAPSRTGSLTAKRSKASRSRGTPFLHAARTAKASIRATTGSAPTKGSATSRWGR